MDQIFQRIIDHNFSDLKGATVQASVPVLASLINEVLPIVLQGNRTIESCQVTLHPENRVSVSVKTTLLPWPIDLKMRLDRSVDLTSYATPKLRAWMENNLLFGKLGSWLNALPEGIKLYGNQIVIDLGSFLTAEQRRLVPLVKSAGIRTEEGSLLLDIRIAVE